MLITSPGHTWVTDLGRLSGARSGVPANGAMDHFSARTANILVGNDEAAPLLETLAVAVEFLAQCDLLLAVTGAECELRIDGALAPLWAPVSARAGQAVSVGPARKGLRSYVAVRGSLDVPYLLGSCAPDTMVGFGTRLRAGDVLSGARPTAPLAHPVFRMPVMRLPVEPPALDDEPVIPVTDGPDHAEFGATASLLYRGSFAVSDRSNHVGLRLSGELPTRLATGEVLSRGVPIGAIEVPSSEGLLVLHRGRGVTAGYPVLAVLTSVGLDQIAQVRPGSQVRFRRVSITEARDAVLAQHHVLSRLRRAVRTVLAAHGASLEPIATSTERELSAV